MQININNCRESFDTSLKQIESTLEPLQKDNYDVRMSLVNARLMYVTANNVLDAYEELKNGNKE